MMRFTKINTSEPQNISSSNQVFEEQFLYKKVVFCLIAIVAILGNSLFCAVLVRKRALLRRPYNKLLLSLSVTDLLTGELLYLSHSFFSYSVNLCRGSSKR